MYTDVHRGYSSFKSQRKTPQKHSNKHMYTDADQCVQGSGFYCQPPVIYRDWAFHCTVTQCFIAVYMVAQICHADLSRDQKTLNANVSVSLVYQSNSIQFFFKTQRLLYAYSLKRLQLSVLECLHWSVCIDRTKNTRKIRSSVISICLFLKATFCFNHKGAC